MTTTNQLLATVGKLPWSTSAVAHSCMPGVDVGSPERGTGGGTTLIFFPTVQDDVWVLAEVLCQWNKCDAERLEELAAASIHSAHRQFVTGHSPLAEQQQAG